MTYQKLYNIKITPKVFDMLLATKRLHFGQRADPLAIGQAISQLIEDWVVSGLPMQDFIDAQKKAAVETAAKSEEVTVASSERQRDEPL